MERDEIYKRIRALLHQMEAMQSDLRTDPSRDAQFAVGTIGNASATLVMHFNNQYGVTLRPEPLEPVVVPAPAEPQIKLKKAKP